MKQIDTLKFKKFCMSIGNLPSSYVESLSYYECLMWLCNYLEKTVIPAVNNNAEAVTELQGLYIELKNYVDNYFDNLDVQEEINNKLDEMVEDGTLETLMRKYISINNINYISNIMALEYRRDGDSRGLQGGCYCGDGNIACYFKETNTIQVISLSTGNVLREATYEILGHGNGMCKIDNYLYIVGTGDENNNCYKVDYETLQEIEVVDVFGEDKIPAGTNISCIAYSTDNEKVYITSAPVFPTLTTYVFNKDLSELLNTYTFNNEDSYGGFITNICYWNKYIVINYNYGKLQLFNQENMSLYKEINLDLNSGNRYYSEIEWLDSYENNELIFGAVGFIGQGYGSGNIIFGKTNLYSSNRVYPVITTKASTENKYPRKSVIFVDNTVTYNPTRDGSFSAPFQNVYEAMNSCLVDGFDETDILFKGDYSNDGLYIESSRLVRLYSNNTNSKVDVREIHCQSNNMILIKDIVPREKLYIKESNVTYNYSLNTPIELEIEGYNTSVLNISTGANMILLKGYSDGIVNFTSFNSGKNIVGIYDNINLEYKDLFFCRNINNVYQRCRLDGALHQNESTLQFITALNDPKKIMVQVDSTYFELPFIGFPKTYSITTPNNKTLSVTIAYDTTTYSKTTLKYTLSVDNSGVIFDAFIQY